MNQPKWFALVVGVVLAAGKMVSPIPGEPLFAGRSYFGVHWVIQTPANEFHALMHGTTLHGFQSLEPAERCKPLTYYHRTGPLGDVVAALPSRPKSRQVAVVGLGTGATVCYAGAQRRFTFYEIDPLVKELAEDPRYFTYLSQCGKGRYEIVLGDGRLRLEQAPPRRYGLIILDAFSSDAIPLHLLTREAVRSYLAALADDGMLAFHVSNIHLDLAPMLGDLAGAEGLECLVCRDMASEEELAEGKTHSTYVVMAPRRETLSKLAANPRWQPLYPRPGKHPWTDNYSNVLDVVNWSTAERE
jgi:hypothetical protein